MIEFYSPGLPDDCVLPEGESLHASRVLRLKEGEEISVVDGRGTRYLCRITDSHPKRMRVEILSSEKVEKHWKGKITIAVAPTKNIDRIEWLLEKALEIGIDEFVLLQCARSERKTVREERLEKIMVSGMKQSLKAYLPKLQPLMPLQEFLKEEREGEKYVGYCGDDFPLKEYSREYHAGQDVTIVIGPEGDFTGEEISSLAEHGYVPVTFGRTRLRTETAALYALTATHVLNE